MNGYPNTFKLGFEPGFQVIIVLSALMHIIAIAFVTDPFGARNKVDDSYFVKLVMPAKINQTPKANLIKKSLKKEEPVVNIKPEKKQKPAKKQVEVKSPDVSIKPIEKKSIKKSHVAKKQSSKSLLPLAKSRTVSGRNYSIKRKVQSSKTKYNSDAPRMDRTGRGSNFTAKTDIAGQGTMIAGNGVSGRSGFKSVAKGVREQSFAALADKNNEAHMIEQGSRVVENESVPVENALRDSMFTASGQREEVDENQYAISRAEDAVKKDIFPEYPDDDTVEYPETDFSSNPGMESITGNHGMPAISRPAVSAQPVIKKGSPKADEKQLIKETVPDSEERENSNTSPQLAIQGVPLDQLNACTNALDERTLKKDILHIIGDKKECYNQLVGEYLFIGTARFASFDMKILPRAGRKLSNRCEELRNAFQCLTLK